MAPPRMRYIAWRDGRPRFVPGPRERALGYKGEDLKHPDGRWFGEVEAFAWSRERADEIARARAGEKPPELAGRTVADLVKDYLASPDFQKLRLSSQRDYRSKADAIFFRPQTAEARKAKLPRQPESFAQAPVKAIGRPEVKAFHDYLERERGAHSARGVVAVLGAAMKWGTLSLKWRLAENVATQLALVKPPGRIMVWEAHEIEAMVAAADALGRPSIGDAVLLGVHTGQRQGDRLLLVDAGLIDGRRRFLQSKTGAVVMIKPTRVLTLRLEQAALRRAAVLEARLGLAGGRWPVNRRRPPTVILSEMTGRPYGDYNYRHIFDEVRAAAAAGIPDGAGGWKVEPCPSLAGKRDQDLRDTCVTWLFRAGVDALGICSITGHSAASVETIRKHYLGAAPDRADEAIDALEAFMERNG